MKKAIFTLAAITAILFAACGSGDEQKKDATDAKANFDACNAHLKELLAVYQKIDTVTPFRDTIFNPFPEKYKNKTFTLLCADYKFLKFLSDTSLRGTMKDYKPFRNTGVNLTFTDRLYLDYAFWHQQNDTDYAKFLERQITKNTTDDASLIAVITPIIAKDPVIGSGEFQSGKAKCFVEIYDYKTGMIYCSFFASAENGDSVKVPESATAVEAKKFVVSDLRFKFMSDITDHLKQRAGFSMMPVIVQ